MIDIGVNLLHGQFDPDRAEVLVRAAAAGVETVIITGTDLASSAAAQRYIDSQPNSAVRLYSTVGVHPHDAASAPSDLRRELHALAGHSAVAAIGEAGLDFHRNFSPRDAQERVFREQVELAAELNRTLFVHDRDSDGAVAETLQSVGIRPQQVITGTREQLAEYLDAGYWIGITGWVCDRKRGRALREFVTDIPLDRLLIETDAPFLLPHTVPKDHEPGPQGRRNEPAFLPFVAEQLADLYQLPVADLAARCAQNSRAAFNLE